MNSTQNSVEILSQLPSEISAILMEEGFARFGMVPIQGAVSLELYQTWLQNGYHGSMTYLVDHLQYKQDPQAFFGQVRSAIVVSQPIFPHPKPSQNIPKGLKIAKYARGQDYHSWLKEKLEKVASKLKARYHGSIFLVATDSKPLLERDFAARARLGWIGKNSCLINQKEGSHFLIGEILTTLHLEAQLDLSPDRCGTCTRCIEACPTQAILDSRTLDAKRCISYLTIESKTSPPESLRQKIGSHFFGCDICQDVCPWNQKILANEVRESQGSRDDTVRDLKFFLKASNRQIMDRIRGTPLERARPNGLRRNAVIVTVNLCIQELRNEISELKNKPGLATLVQWAIEKLDSESSVPRPSIH